MERHLRCAARKGHASLATLCAAILEANATGSRTQSVPIRPDGRTGLCLALSYPRSRRQRHDATDEDGCGVDVRSEQGTGAWHQSTTLYDTGIYQTGAHRHGFHANAKAHAAITLENYTVTSRRRGTNGRQSVPLPRRSVSPSQPAREQPALILNLVISAALPQKS